jgi:hypothetical protein
MESRGAVLRFIGQTVLRAALLCRVAVIDHVGGRCVLRVHPVDQVAGKPLGRIEIDPGLLLEAEGEALALFLIFRDEILFLQQVLQQVHESVEGLRVRLLLPRSGTLDQAVQAELPVLVQDRGGGRGTAHARFRGHRTRVRHQESRLEPAGLAEHARQQKGHELLVFVRFVVPRAGRSVEALPLGHLKVHPQQGNGRLEAGLGRPVGVEPVLVVLGDLEVFLGRVCEGDHERGQHGDHHEDHEQGDPVLTGQSRPHSGRHREEMTHVICFQRH